MTQRVAEMRVRINSIVQLRGAISALRGIAASHVQQSRERLSAMSTYSDIVARAISQALSLLPERREESRPSASGRTAAVLFCAEQGFAGTFSEAVLERLRDLPANPIVLCVGSRGLTRARAQGVTIDWSAPMASQIGSVSSLASRIVAALEQRLHDGQVVRAEMILQRPSPAGALQIERRPLLPVDLGRFGAARQLQPPLINLPPADLMERLAAEYLFAQVSEAILHSFAAENTARLAAMAAARDNIDQRLETLRLEERVARQGEITDEVIELSAGAEALRGSAATGQ